METKEVVHRAYHDVDGGRVSRLSSEVVLEVSVVTFAEKLKEAKETLCEEMVGKDLAEN